MELELKHLAPYLPYKVKCRSKTTGTVFTITGFNDRKDITTFGDLVMSKFESTQLLLRPLSDLTNEIEIDGKKLIPIHELIIIADGYVSDEENYSYWWYSYINGISQYSVDVHRKIENKLYEWIFDIFGLIKKGIAVDINTVIALDIKKL
jgi:hypothetical protein